MLEAAAASCLGPTMGRGKKLGFLCLAQDRDQPHGPASWIHLVSERVATTF